MQASARHGHLLHYASPTDSLCTAAIVTQNQCELYIVTCMVFHSENSGGMYDDYGHSRVAWCLLNENLVHWLP